MGCVKWMVEVHKRWALNGRQQIMVQFRSSEVLSPWKQLLAFQLTSQETIHPPIATVQLEPFVRIKLELRNY